MPCMAESPELLTLPGRRGLHPMLAIRRRALHLHLHTASLVGLLYCRRFFLPECPSHSLRSAGFVWGLRLCQPRCAALRL